MDNELVQILLDSIDKHNKRLDNLDKTASLMAKDVDKIAKDIPSKVSAEVAKIEIPKPDNADYGLLKRLMEEDIAKYLDKHNMTVKELETTLTKYIDSIQPTDEDIDKKVTSYIKTLDLVGPAGKDGKDGQTVVGPIGPQGKTGPKGPKGKDGVNGKDGTSSSIDKIEFDNGKLKFTVDGKVTKIDLGIPQGYGGGSSKVAAKLSELKDVKADRPKIGQVLKWNGSKWESSKASSTSLSTVSTSQTLSTLSDVVFINVVADSIITLPSPVDEVGTVVNLKRIDTTDSVVTINSVVGSIDGTNSFTIDHYENFKVISDGTNWYIL